MTLLPPLRRAALLLLCTLPLAACNYFGSSDDDGGGGGNSDAQGIWNGSLTSDTLALHMLVAPNNELWAMSWSEQYTQVRRMTRGTGSLNGKSFSGTGTTLGTGDTTAENATITGTVATGASFDGNLGQNVTFTSTFNSQYNNAFELGSFAGTWQGRDSTNSAVNFTIQSNGDLEARFTISGRPDDCIVRGALAKPSSGKNYATLSASFGNATNCLSQHAGASMQGVAMRLTEQDKQPLLLVMATNTGKTAGWFAYARLNAAEVDDETETETETGTEDKAE
ncbi:hypothetical protein PIGHUM_02648 [Pigmentiphaga humi]|uniref:Lipoprotein n=1 Tax=Pigmentiphaga humi TaxID=2478468 RepID=A0A3P4B3E6_9BURK|nr:hypothetical protein [Pigmentiphaga humi]VCU70572.1 hypothetical protein PIGHUM_02648 [Pigmentiphaga humi]